MSNNKVSIILAKANWCQHCIHFTPIFKLAEEQINKQLKLEKDIDKDFVFYSFDVENSEEKEKFKNEFPGLIDFIEGYPTVYMQSHNGKNIRTDFIDHVNINSNNNEDLSKTEVINRLQNEAASKFINNIINKYKTIYSPTKDLYINLQNGGASANIKRISSNQYTTLEESKYRHKYLKYKNKYLNMLNK